MTSLNISNNGLTRGKLQPEPRYVMSDERPWGSKDKHYESDMAGVAALADGIKNNGALAKLDIRNNGIPDDQQADLKGICTSKSIELTL